MQHTTYFIVLSDGGELVMMAAPTTTHQMILSWLLTEIAVYIRGKKGKCHVIPSPYAVILKEDGKNYLEPDIVVVCDESKLKESGCHGAPDWVIEIVSSSSRSLDYGRKLNAYMEAGVREYWIVDPEKKAIIVYCPNQLDMPVIYHFGDCIKPVIYEDFTINSAPLGEMSYSEG